MAHVRSPAIVAAFATVPREHFTGPGPWRLLSPWYSQSYWTTEDADPRHLYHDPNRRRSRIGLYRIDRFPHRRHCLRRHRPGYISIPWISATKRGRMTSTERLNVSSCASDHDDELVGIFYSVMVGLTVNPHDGALPRARFLPPRHLLCKKLPSFPLQSGANPQPAAARSITVRPCPNGPAVTPRA